MGTAGGVETGAVETGGEGDRESDRAERDFGLPEDRIFGKKGMVMNRVIEVGGFHYYVERDGWCHVVDPEMPDSVREKAHITEFIRTASAEEAIEFADKIGKYVRGVGRKTVEKWMEDAGWKPGWIKTEEK